MARGEAARYQEGDQRFGPRGGQQRLPGPPLIGPHLIRRGAATQATTYGNKSQTQEWGFGGGADGTIKQPPRTAAMTLPLRSRPM